MIHVSERNETIINVFRGKPITTSAGAIYITINQPTLNLAETDALIYLLLTIIS